MPDKQERYRKRKSEQGFQRVEVNVPKDTAPLLKAYARALRDAHSLDLDAPLFDGMKRQIDDCPLGTAVEEHDHRSSSARNATPLPGDRIAQPEDGTKNRSRKKSPLKPRPDFSRGLLDD